MNKKQTILYSLALSASIFSSAYAADISNLNVQSNTYEGSAETQDQSNTQWSGTSKPTAAASQRFSYSVSVHGGSKRVTMKPLSSYTCTLSGVEGQFRGWMEQAKVLQEDGNWVLYVDAGDTTVVARGMCWSL